MSFFPLKRVFALVFSLDSCRADMNLNQTFISAPGTVMHYNCVYMPLVARIFHFKNTFCEWIVHVGGCMT